MYKFPWSIVTISHKTVCEIKFAIGKLGDSRSISVSQYNLTKNILN